jgi:hypothetical protein
MIFGHVPLAVQRSRIPAFGRPRTGSGQSVHQSGPSAPAWYIFSAPSGVAKRAFKVIRRPAMIGQAPSYTFLLSSPWVNPSWMNARRKLPDCETPRLITQDTFPATGFGVPTSSFVAFLKKVATSRKAAKPIPSTYGSFAVNTT